MTPSKYGPPLSPGSTSEHVPITTSEVTSPTPPPHTSPRTHAYVDDDVYPAACLAAGFARTGVDVLRRSCSGSPRPRRPERDVSRPDSGRVIDQSRDFPSGKTAVNVLDSTCFQIIFLHGLGENGYVYGQRDRIWRQTAPFSKHFVHLLRPFGSNRDTSVTTASKPDGVVVVSPWFLFVYLFSHVIQRTACTVLPRCLCLFLKLENVFVRSPEDFSLMSSKRGYAFTNR